METDLQELIANSCTLPPMPVVATRVMREMMNPNASADSLSKIIETDEALVIRILKIANSAFYGCARKVSSIQLAIVVLGFNTLKNLVIATSTKSLYHQQNETEHALWEHSLAVGVASHVLAIAFCPSSLEDAFTAGLLHDLGKLILYTQNAEQYAALLGEQHDTPCHVSEQQAYGFTHADVGAALVHQWSLPETFESTIGLHHSIGSGRFDELKPQAKGLTALINLADDITKKVLVPVGKDVPTDAGAPADVMQVLGISEDQIDGYLSMIKETFEAEKNLFDL